MQAMSVMHSISAALVINFFMLACAEHCQPTGSVCLAGMPCCEGECVNGTCGYHPDPPPQCLELGMHCNNTRNECCSGMECNSGRCSQRHETCAVKGQLCNLFGITFKKNCCAGLACQGWSSAVQTCQSPEDHVCAAPGQMCEWNGFSTSRTCCPGSSCTVGTALGRACSIPNSCGDEGDQCRWVSAGYHRPCCGQTVCRYEGDNMTWKCGYRLRGRGGNGVNASTVEIEGATDRGEQDAKHDADETTTPPKAVRSYGPGDKFPAKMR